MRITPDTTLREIDAFLTQTGLHLKVQQHVAYRGVTPEKFSDAVVGHLAGFVDAGTSQDTGR